MPVAPRTPTLSLLRHRDAANLTTRDKIPSHAVCCARSVDVVSSSAIHGYGVVTTRAFAQGETVCFGDGVLYDADDDFDDTYALILPGDDSESASVFWDLVDQTRWFNHSCDPNTEVLLALGSTSATTVRAWWVALRDIALGEEITYDYGFVADVAEPCACGAGELPRPDRRSRSRGAGAAARAPARVATGR